MRTFELGEVIAERRLEFRANAGWSRDVWVRFGKPQVEASSERGRWFCPYQIAGLNSDRVVAIFGIDSMQAVVLAMHTIPAELAALMRELDGRFFHLDHVERTFQDTCKAVVDTMLPDGIAHRPPEGSPLRFFLNVDLDIETDANPAALVQALEPHAYSLERPPGRASFELNPSTVPPAPDALIREFVRLVQRLPPDARDIWNGAARRVFDIGIQSQRDPFSETHSLTSETLRDAANVKAEIAFTTYSLRD